MRRQGDAIAIDPWQGTASGEHKSVAPSAAPRQLEAPNKLDCESSVARAQAALDRLQRAETLSDFRAVLLFEAVQRRLPLARAISVASGSGSLDGDRVAFRCEHPVDADDDSKGKDKPVFAKRTGLIQLQRATRTLELCWTPDANLNGSVFRCRDGGTLPDGQPVTEKDKAERVEQLWTLVRRERDTWPELRDWVDAIRPPC